MIMIRITLGALFVLGTAFVVTEDAWRSGNVTTDHLLTVLAIAAAVGAAHVATTSGRQRLAFGALFLAATSVVVIKAADRYGSHIAAKAAAIEHRNSERRHLEAALKQTADTLKDARTKRDSECASGKGSKCEGRRASVADTELELAGLEQRRATLGPFERTHSGAAAVLSAITSIDPDKIERVLANVLPVAMVLVTELAAILFLQPVRRPGSKPEPKPDAEPQPNAAPQHTEQHIQPAEAEFVRALRAVSVDGVVTGSQRELARRLGVPVTAFNRQLQAAKMARALSVDTSNNRTVITLSQ